MAHYGGPTSPPRVHRPRAPVMSAPPPLTAPLAPLRPQPTTVTLNVPRPENERAANEYVETPFRQATTPPPPPQPTLPPPPPPQPPRNQQRPVRLAPLPIPSTAPSPHQQPPPVTKQPPHANAAPTTTTASFSKEPSTGSAGAATAMAMGAAIECAARPSIMCPECSRCRCESCQQPRPLPHKWVCNETILLSADSIIDYASCLCCVKGLFYHCSESESGESCADDPCGCGPDRRKARWGCLGALSFVLPCLWLYWPLRGCKSVVEQCYARHSRTGCRCRPPLATPEKRLLDSSQDF